MTTPAFIPPGPCGRIGCDGKGTKYPVLLLWPTNVYGPGVQPFRSIIGLGICDQHAAKTTVKDYLTDGAWERIVAMIEAMGYVTPDRERLELEWVPWHDSDVTLLRSKEGDRVQ